MTTQNDYEKYYQFRDYYIDLEKLVPVEPNVQRSRYFQTESHYKQRFAAPNDWLDNWPQWVENLGSEFKIKENNSMVVTDDFGNPAYPENNEKGWPIDNIVGANFLIPAPDGAVHITRYEGEKGYRVNKYDVAGKQVFAVHIEHTDIVVEGNTHYHHPYLHYFVCTSRYLVFTSNDRDYQKSVVLDMEDGNVTEYPFSIIGIVRDTDETGISGFVISEKQQGKFKTMIINLSWTAELKNESFNRAETLLKGDTLYIAFYHYISTGSSLYAFEMSTGKQLWQADVKQLNVGHSEYWNTVHLTAYKDRLILEGIEAYGTYLQVFSMKDGSRLFSNQ